MVCLPKIYHKNSTIHVGKYTNPMDPSWSKFSPTPGRWAPGPGPPTVLFRNFFRMAGVKGEVWCIFPGAHVGKFIDTVDG